MNEDAKSVSLIELLDRLVEPVEPTSVSMWPQTWGWAVVGAMLALLLAYAGWRWWLGYRANAYRREALQALQSAGGDATVIATIIRRTALTAYPRSDVAALNGVDWLRFLDERSGGKAFSSSPDFASAPYAGDRRALRGDYDALAEHWIKTHEAGSKR